MALALFVAPTSANAAFENGTYCVNLNEPESVAQLGLTTGRSGGAVISSVGEHAMFYFSAVGDDCSSPRSCFMIIANSTFEISDVKLLATLSSDDGINGTATFVFEMGGSEIEVVSEMREQQVHTMSLRPTDQSVIADQCPDL